MNSRILILGAALPLFLAGCASTPVVLAPIGPNPSGLEARAATGQLQVFSAVETQTDGNNPSWYQHSDYIICDQRGNPMKHVENTTGYYATAPRVVTLPPGKYIVKAPANDYLSVKVPVVIEPGRTTKVHLDDAWKVPAASSKTEIVSAPSGYPVGWSSGDTQ